MTRLSELAKLKEFAGQAAQRGEARDAFWDAYGRVSNQSKHRGKRVTDLVGTVMALSARTRRVVQPRVAVELDVFGPNGKRAMRLFQPD